MNGSKTNLKFTYMYRDAGNYKNYGSVIFSNPNNVSIEELRRLIRTRLIDGEYFDHQRLNIPALFFSPRNSDDHSWHEYENMEETDEAPTDARTIDDFLLSLRHSKSATI